MAGPKKTTTHGLASDKSPGMSYKNQFAYERYGIKWRTLEKRIIDNAELLYELQQLKINLSAGKKVKEKVKLLTPAQKELIIQYLG